MHRLLCGLTLCWFAGSLTAADRANIDCISQLELPLRLDLAGEPGPKELLLVPVGGVQEVKEREATARIDVGKNGQLARLRVTGSSPGLLNKLLAEHLQSTVKLDSKCAGRTVELQFTFRFGGRVSWQPQTRVTLRGSNHFIIEHEPGVAIVDEIPLEEKGQGASR